MPELELGAIITEGMQTRAVAYDEATVQEYCDQMFEGAEFPPLEVAEVKGRYYLWDGFHRFEAFRRLERRKVPVNVTRVKDKDAALELALAANQKHGLRLTNADKRHKVELALKLWPKASNREISRKTGVSDVTVGAVLKSVSAKVLQIDHAEPFEEEQESSVRIAQIAPPAPPEDEQASTPETPQPAAPETPKQEAKPTPPVAPTPPEKEEKDPLEGVPQRLRAAWQEVVRKGGTPKLAYRGGKPYVMDISKAAKPKVVKATPKTEAETVEEYDRLIEAARKNLYEADLLRRARGFPIARADRPDTLMLNLVIITKLLHDWDVFETPKALTFEPPKAELIKA